jgi:cupin fold WbuC family metalloprotein
MFGVLIAAASNHSRKRKMVDFTNDPANDGLQIIMNTWTEGSYSPVHMHLDYAETFMVLEGTLLFWTWDADADLSPTCHVLSADGDGRGIVVDKKTWHAMTAAPAGGRHKGHAVVFETSAHKFDPTKSTKVLAPFAPESEGGLNGDPDFFLDLIDSTCKLR